jgi:hypothetical protein
MLRISMSARIDSSPEFEREYRAKLLANSSGVTRGQSVAPAGGMIARPVIFTVWLSLVVRQISQ